jgi:hypothetical protein
MSGPNLERVRGNVLNRIEQFERRSRWVVYALAVLELAFIVSILLLADFKDRLQLLLVIIAFAVYSILGLGLIVLGIHVSRCTERVLQAIDLTRRDQDQV